MPVPPPDETGIIGQPVGGPGGDPGDTCDINYQLWLPTNGILPAPLCLSLRSAHYSENGLQEVDGPLYSIVQQGFIGVYFEPRLMKGGLAGGAGIPGQTTDGRYQQQENDVAQAIEFWRADPRVDGFVLGLGGSGSAADVLWNILAEIGSRRFDAAIPLSPPTDAGDRDADMYSRIITILADYHHADPMDTTQATLDRLTAESAIGQIAGLADDPHILHYGGGMETIPVSQFNRFATAMAAAGKVNYIPLFVPESRNHSFGAWPHWVQATAIPLIKQWHDDFINGGGGGGEPPPPPPPPTREFITMRATGLAPSTFYTAAPFAIDKATGLSGPTNPVNFVSDRDDTQTTGKDLPEGNYVLVDAPGGVPPDLSLRPYWAFDYLDGARLTTNMAVVNPANKQFDFSVITGFLALCSSKSKLAGIGIECGIRAPSYVYGHGIQSFTFTNGSKMPLPWDTGYQTILQQMIRALSASFEGNPTLDYIAFSGFSQLIDAFLVDGTDFNALTAVAVAGGFPDLATAFLDAAEGLISYTAKAFKSTPGFLQLDYPVPVGFGGTDAIDNLTVWLNDTLKSRAGFMSDKLTAATDGTEHLDGIIHDQSRRSQVGYQFAAAATDETDLVNTATAGINLGAAFIEYKEADMLITTNNYPTHFAAFQTALKANSHN